MIVRGITMGHRLQAEALPEWEDVLLISTLDADHGTPARVPIGLPELRFSRAINASSRYVDDDNVQRYHVPIVDVYTRTMLTAPTGVVYVLKRTRDGFNHQKQRTPTVK